jgi:hypothetical protein
VPNFCRAREQRSSDGEGPRWTAYEGPRCTAFSLPSRALLWKSDVLPLQNALTRLRTITGKAFTLSTYKPPFSQTTRFAFCPLSTRARHTILRRSGQPPCTRTCSTQSMNDGCRTGDCGRGQRVGQRIDWWPYPRPLLWLSDVGTRFL